MNRAESKILPALFTPLSLYEFYDTYYCMNSTVTTMEGRNDLDREEVIMKEYTDRQSTPLAFHKFYWFVGIPTIVIWKIWVIYHASSLGLNGWYYFDIIISLAITVLGITSFIGFFKWKKYAWISVILFTIALFLVDRLVVGSMSLYYEIAYGNNVYTEEEHAGRILGCILPMIFFLVSSACIIKYYRKRRALFTNNGNNTDSLTSVDESRNEGIKPLPNDSENGPGKEPIDKNKDSAKNTESFCVPANRDNSEETEFIQLRKLKELLDDGIITQDDYDRKKKQLLGL